MAKRNRKTRSFTFPDSFMERLSATALRRETTMSQLLQELAETGIAIDEYIVRLHEEGELGDEPIAQLLQDEYLRDIARGFVEARGPNDLITAEESLRDWQERHYL